MFAMVLSWSVYNGVFLTGIVCNGGFLTVIQSFSVIHVVYVILVYVCDKVFVTRV